MMPSMRDTLPSFTPHSNVKSYDNQMPTATYTITMPSLSGSRENLAKPITSYRTRTLAGVIAVLLITLAALALACFVFGYGYSRLRDGELPTRHVSPSRSQRLSEAALAKKTDQFVDSEPSGFDNTVDYVFQYDSPSDEDLQDYLGGPVVGSPEAHPIFADESMTAEETMEMWDRLKQQYPEQFENEGPAGAVPFAIDTIDTSDWSSNGNDETPQRPEGSNYWDYPEANMDVFDTPTFTNQVAGAENFLVDPPTGPWQTLVTPPPMPMEKPVKVTFQETEDQLEWPMAGPAGATWFAHDTGIDVSAPKETRISAQWLGDGCSIVTDEAGLSSVEGGDKCGETVWYPYHYDVYPNSAASDWEYVDMKEGPRSHAWPGAGPFRKIQIQTGVQGRDGPVCFDLPREPADYRGVIPDELDCALYLTPVNGYGDDKEYTSVHSLSADGQLSEWWFQWRQL